MTKFKLDRYDVLVQTETGPVEHRVTVYHPDELRAEREAPKYGLAIKVDPETQEVDNLLANHLRTLQVWSALKRDQKYDKPFANFMNTDCLALQEVEAEVVDPTSAATAAPSSSDTTGLPSLSGSTQTDPVETPA